MALERSGQLLNRVSATFFNLNGHTYNGAAHVREQLSTYKVPAHVARSASERANWWSRTSIASG